MHPATVFSSNLGRAAWRAGSGPSAALDLHGLLAPNMLLSHPKLIANPLLKHCNGLFGTAMIPWPLFHASYGGRVGPNERDNPAYDRQPKKRLVQKIAVALL